MELTEYVPDAAIQDARLRLQNDTGKCTVLTGAEAQQRYRPVFRLKGDGFGVFSEKRFEIHQTVKKILLTGRQGLAGFLIGDQEFTVLRVKNQIGIAKTFRQGQGNAGVIPGQGTVDGIAVKKTPDIGPGPQSQGPPYLPALLRRLQAGAAQAATRPT